MNKNSIGDDFCEVIENLQEFEYPDCWINHNCNVREDQP